MHGVVPITVELIAGEWHRGQLLVADLDAGGVVPLIELGVDLEPLRGRGVGDELHHDAVGREWPSSPAPPAVPSATPNNPAGSGTIATSCNPPNPTSTVAGPTPTVLPPTGSVTPLVTVTNCGTVTEDNVAVTETLALADGPGASAPPTGATGSSARTTVTTVSGQSQALSFPGLKVAGGHNYMLTIRLAPPTGQQNLAGTSQQFLLQIVS